MAKCPHLYLYDMQNEAGSMEESMNKKIQPSDSNFDTNIDILSYGNKLCVVEYKVPLMIESRKVVLEKIDENVVQSDSIITPMSQSPMVSKNTGSDNTALHTESENTGSGDPGTAYSNSLHRTEHEESSNKITDNTGKSNSESESPPIPSPIHHTTGESSEITDSMKT